MDKLTTTRNHPAYKKFLGTSGARVKLAAEINEARVLKGWTQQKLAREAGTTQKVISKIENGDTNVGFDLLRRITYCLNLEFCVGKTIFAGKAEAVSMRKVETQSELANSVVSVAR